VKDLLGCKEVTDVTDQWDAFKEKLPNIEEIAILDKRARNMLTRLWQRLTQTPLINYFPVENQKLDEVLDIFVRVNSAGKPLSKTDLLFSTIVAHWEKGREEIEAFLERINKLGNGFGFDNDFMMRTCLVLADCPVRLRVASFKQENVRRIVDLWKDITAATEKAVELLDEWGFQSETLTAANAVIPIAYAIKKGCDVQASKGDLRLYLIKSLLSGVYSGQGDQLLADIRKYLQSSLELSTKFSLGDFEQSAKLAPGKSIAISDSDLDSLLMSEKGARSFMLLSLISPNLKFHKAWFHQDHIHPHSGFGTSDLASLGIGAEEAEQWRAKRDCVPNLQLLEGKENHTKSKTSFVDWIAKEYPDQQQKKDFLNSQSIPIGCSLELRDFEAFFEGRNKLLKSKLAELLRAGSSASPARN
jgi:hypothetical protein